MEISYFEKKGRAGTAIHYSLLVIRYYKSVIGLYLGTSAFMIPQAMR
jgi:hypothetical protein